jgi:hypothetical protein
MLSRVLFQLLTFSFLAAAVSACASAPAAPDKTDPLLMAQVEKALTPRRPDIKACYENEPGNIKNKPSGVITIRFVIGSLDGKLIGAAVQGPGTTLDEPNVASCLLDVIISTHFSRPQTAGGHPLDHDLQVVYPFRFGGSL